MIAVWMLLDAAFGTLWENRGLYILGALLVFVVGFGLAHLTKPQFSPLPEAEYFHGTSSRRFTIEVCLLPLLYILTFGGIALAANELGVAPITTAVMLFLVLTSITALWAQHAASGVMRRVSMPSLREDICTTHLSPGTFLRAMLIHPLLARLAPLGPIYITTAVFIMDSTSVEMGGGGFVRLGVLVYLALFLVATIFLTHGNLMRNAAPPEEAEDIPGGGIVTNFGILVLLVVGFMAGARMEAISSEATIWYGIAHPALEVLVHLFILGVLTLGFIHRAGEAATAAHLGFLLSSEQFIGATEFDE